MAVDAQILKLLGEQDKRQSNYRQVSRDYMKNSASVLDSINQSVRYNTSQSNSLKSGLGEITGKLLGEIKSNKKSDNSELSNKSPVVQRLDDIKNILNKQYDLIDKYINKQFESDETKITTDNKDKDKEDLEQVDPKNPKAASNTGSGLGYAIGSMLAAALVPFIEPLSSVFNAIKVAGSALWNVIRSGASKAWNFIKGGASKLWKNIRSGASKAWKSIRSGASRAWSRMSKTLSRMRSGLSNAVKNIKSAFSKAGNIAKNLGNSLKSAASSVGGFIKSMGSKLANLTKSVGSKLSNLTKSAASGLKAAASKAGSLIKSAGSGLKNVGGKAGSFMKMLPGVGNVSKIAKGAKRIVKRLPLISAAFEGADAAQIAAMSESEREEYLDSIAKDMEGKSILGRAWYAFNNNSKTIAAAIGTFKDTQKLNQENQNAEARIAEMEAELARRKAAKAAEKEKLEPIDETDRDRELRENLNKYFEQRMNDEEYMRNLPTAPTVINQTTVTMPTEDYGTTIRRGSK